MWTYNETPYSDELYHHGIKGQKWGTRNGPPYPLDKSVSTGSRLKKVKGSDRGFVTDGYDAAYQITKAIVGAYREKKAQEKSAKELADIGGEFKKKTVTSSAEDDVKVVNPAFKKLIKSKGATNNCMYCTMAFDLRRRGYDVTAKEILGGIGYQDQAKLYKPPATPDFVSEGIILKNGWPFRDMSKLVTKKALASHGLNGDLPKQMNAQFEKMAKETPNQRGELSVSWGVGGAHSMAYEIKDGVYAVYDAQNGKKYTGDSLNKHLKYAYTGILTRLDDKEPDLEAMKRYVR